VSGQIHAMSDIHLNVLKSGGGFFKLFEKPRGCNTDTADFSGKLKQGCSFTKSLNRLSSTNRLELGKVHQFPGANQLGSPGAGLPPKACG
jgi:hypothetical protein